jgi:hypothetical protein
VAFWLTTFFGFTMMRALLLVLSLVVVGCSSKPPVPQWQKLSTQAVEQATAAALQGQDRLADHQWAAALAQARRTARPEPIVRVELIRCAVVQASTLQTGCSGFDAFAMHAPEADRAYARYLSGQVTAADVTLLPQAHRAAAAALLSGADPVELVQALQNIADPLSRLVAASVAIQKTPALPVVAEAVESASAQGWQRPLVTWLTLQRRLAQDAGQAELAAQAQQRLQWLTEAAIKPPQPN